MPTNPNEGSLMLKTCWYSPRILLFLIPIPGKNGKLKSYPVAKNMVSTSSTIEPSSNVTALVSGFNRAIDGRTSMCGCVKGAHPNAGNGWRRDAMMGCLETARISCSASKADTDPPTTTTFYLLVRPKLISRQAAAYLVGIMCRRAEMLAMLDTPWVSSLIIC